MTSYSKKLIKEDLVNIKNWAKKANWKEVKKQLYTIINKNYNSKYLVHNSNSNFVIHSSINRLSQILKSDEIFQLIKDLNKYYYNNEHNSLTSVDDSDVLHGGFDMSSFAGKFKSIAEKAKTHVVKQGKEFAKKQAQQYVPPQLAQQAQQLAQQAQQYVPVQLAQQAQQLAQQAQQLAPQQLAQLAQQAQQLVPQQLAQLSQQAQQLVPQQLIPQQLAQQAQQLAQQAQKYVPQQLAQQAQQLFPQGQNTTFNQVPSVPSSYIQQPQLPVPVPVTVSEPVPVPITEPSTGILNSIFDSAGNIGKKIMGLG
jgi:hypothetical protein